MATVVGRTKLAIHATVDIRPMTMASLSHLCIHQGAREAARRAGPSAVAETCTLSSEKAET